MRTSLLHRNALATLAALLTLAARANAQRPATASALPAAARAFALVRLAYSGDYAREVVAFSCSTGSGTTNDFHGLRQSDLANPLTSP